MTASEIKLDFQRQERIGFGEAALCAQKTVLQIEAILAEAEKQNTPFLLTRLSENQFRVLPDHQRKNSIMTRSPKPRSFSMIQKR